MKKIYIVRHAKSSLANVGMEDFDRTLNERGKKNALAMSEILRAKNIVPDLMITSSAQRTRSTCLQFAHTLHYDSKIIEERKLYHAAPETILTVLSELDHYKRKADVVFCFGHNDGITHFVNLLLKTNIENIPTCGVVEATLTINAWSEISFGCGKMDSFDYP